MLRRALPRAAGEAMRLAVALFSVWLTVSTFVAVGWLRPVVVAGDSMAPHARRGDRVWVDRLRTPRRWDAAVVRSPDDARRLIVKRVIGLPGERVEFARGDVVIDGRVIAKSPDDRRRLRVPVDGAWREPSGWLAGRGWAATPGGWRFDAAENATLRLREPATD
ncbi:MAG: signal peptidase I, partial [Planctomycetota bacterium]